MNNSALPQKFNIGISLVRALMCFEVVLCHFWIFSSQNMLLAPFEILKPVAVPVFMLISFLLTGNSFGRLTFASCRKRLWRIAWPLAGWAIIYWIIYYKAGFVNSVADLLWQTATGHSPNINPSMWFQSVLLAITVLFICIFGRFPQHFAIKLSVVLGMAALALQYTGITFNLFWAMRYELRYPLGRFFEMLPYAAAGVCLAYCKIYPELEKHRFAAISIAAVSFIAVTVLKEVLPLTLSESFGYGGIALMVQSLAAVTAAYLFPFDRMPDFVAKAATQLTKYTLGIYCVHRLVEKMLVIYFNGIFCLAESSFAKCIVIYIVSYSVCYAVDKIPFKQFKMLVN